MKRSVILREVVSQRQHEIEPPCVLGRGAKADLAFSDPTISQRHALILDIEGEPWIQDLQSANGVYLNGCRIVEKAPIKTGDSIQMGQTSFLVVATAEDISEQTIVLHALDQSKEASLDRQKLKLIFELTTSLAQHQDLAALHAEIQPRFTKLFKQDHGCIALFERDGSLKPLFSNTPLESMLLSRSIINRLLQNGESFVLEDALSDAALREQESVLGLHIRSALCAPLICRNQVYGLIYLDRNIPGAYRQDDLEFLRTIASILAPLIENARLLSELKQRGADTEKMLKETQARLLDAERAAAYVRLAQAMAHEIRNPLMAIGGLIRRMNPPESTGTEGTKFQAVVKSVERIESVLREVDDFVRLPAPDRKLTRIDEVIREKLAELDSVWRDKGIRPLVQVTASHLMIPIDPELFKKALSLLIREILPSVSSGSELKITLADSASELAVILGEMGNDRHLGELTGPELEKTPWSLGLFLNLAAKLIADHGGRLLVDAQGHSPLPLMITLPRTIPEH